MGSIDNEVGPYSNDCTFDVPSLHRIGDDGEDDSVGRRKRLLITSIVVNEPIGDHVEDNLEDSLEDHLEDYFEDQEAFETQEDQSLRPQMNKVRNAFNQLIFRVFLTLELRIVMVYDVELS
ncbi:hypothetical protein QVD17_11564 [Tagetes erecta]|uniref:Uncharacterized protein n=1 Tax=Tagetes erecta TaxID=13708 RepID=A0AAD8KY78_TARER|nr:hypothetical protein QVD17_11564 [Tagetes erecta]